ncbi:YoaK family protein [Mycolicibacterium septicum]|uniref:YoaK family protein n=1 Tax=Mycolicibacterium septicum TaxID=98668 RepID=UPI0023E1A7CE|nr:YoaK family protein [Mycolicibacterium septicum]MDF3339332.1 YoaK family protein [Mycolicibacterium septicum]
MTQLDRTRLGLLATTTLTFVTGVVDAVGYLGLDRVFTGNMTGNIVILGMGVAGADDLPVLGPAVALAGFTAGAFAAGLVLRSRPAAGWDTRITVLLGIGALTLVAITAAVVLAGDSPPATGQVVIATAVAAVMGQQAMVARALAVKDMTTVVVTSTLASLAGETWPGGVRGALCNRRLAAILVIFLGAVAGALLLRLHIAVPLGLAAALTCVVVVAGHLRLHRDSAQIGHAAKPDVCGRTVLRLR